MGNLISLMIHTKSGDEVIIDQDSHIFYYESGGLSNIAGLMSMPVRSGKGTMDPEEVRSSIREKNRGYPIL
jgi:threonine aldolase